MQPLRTIILNFLRCKYWHFAAFWTYVVMEDLYWRNDKQIIRNQNAIIQNKIPTPYEKKIIFWRTDLLIDALFTPVGTILKKQ